MKSQYTGQDVKDEKYDISLELAQKHVWRDCYMPLPEIGTRLRVAMNGMGDGVVVAYFVSYGGIAGKKSMGFKEGDKMWFTGIEVKLDKQPDWHLDECGEGRHALVFGTEIRPL